MVIDPGHGGRDPGAVGRRIKEKDVVLSISLKLGELIRENMPDVKVVFTRTTDTFVELHRRAQIANQNKADLFISIHCNSSRESRAFGTETFVMGLHRTEANLEVARKENAAILFEENYQEAYDGYDPNSPESSIIFSLFQNAYLNQSLSMASLIQDQFRENARRVDRGVKQAGFLVLYRVTSPSVLVEVGFISNPDEEAFLASEEGQRRIAQSIFNAFREYKTAQDNIARNAEKIRIAQDNIPVSSSSPDSNPEQVRENTNNTANITQRQNQAQREAIQSGQGVIFKVQVAVSSEKRPLDAPEFQNLQNVEMYFHEGLYKYTFGRETNFEAAAALQRKARQNGFRDAFVVAFKNNLRIPINEARRIENQTGARHP
ncbi:MAG TPA: N-acetylmuramoyl-L-alanine amidase [Bacteroidales bacterium]|nr:N-acetylmuramoyl-L-alanine amidase [Bacteroidales bacterium]